jgi:hypothetical protein
MKLHVAHGLKVSSGLYCAQQSFLQLDWLVDKVLSKMYMIQPEDVRKAKHAHP